MIGITCSGTNGMAGRADMDGRLRCAGILALIACIEAAVGGKSNVANV